MSRTTKSSLSPRRQGDALGLAGYAEIGLSASRSRRHKGHFDVCFEASGSQVALQQALPAMVPQGRIVQLGLGGEFALPINALITREIQLLGSFRFHSEFTQAVQLLGRIDVRPLLTAEISFQRADEAFELANQRDRSMKVQLTF